MVRQLQMHFLAKKASTRGTVTSPLLFSFFINELAQDIYIPVPKDAERHWDVNLILLYIYIYIYKSMDQYIYIYNAQMTEIRVTFPGESQLRQCHVTQHYFRKLPGHRACVCGWVGGVGGGCCCAWDLERDDAWAHVQHIRFFGLTLKIQRTIFFKATKPSSQDRRTFDSFTSS